METLQYQNFFNQVSSIIVRYKKIQEITGENFNVFRILKLEASEVRMHSAFLAELLNPRGTHGQKDVFLKLFVNEFCFKNNAIETSSCKVKVEESIGTISDDGTQGGRIDIIITDRNSNQIIIENKIHAGDQKHQLTRYHNHSTLADLLYLTLDGKLPSLDSKGQLQDGGDFKCYSYEKDILNWLELCRKEVAVYPIIREGITHYINSIKYLTNQTLNQNMQDEITDLIKSNLESSFIIANNLNNACDRISTAFGLEMEEAIGKMNLKCKYGISFKTRYNGMWVWHSNWKYINIGFQFQDFDKELRYGFVSKENPVKLPIPNVVRARIYSLAGNTPKDNDWWPWYKQMEAPYENWSKYAAWGAILDGTMKKIIIEKIEYLLQLSNGCKL